MTHSMLVIHYTISTGNVVEKRRIKLLKLFRVSEMVDARSYVKPLYLNIQI